MPQNHPDMPGDFNPQHFRYSPVADSSTHCEKRNGARGCSACIFLSTTPATIGRNPPLNALFVSRQMPAVAKARELWSDTNYPLVFAITSLT
jgi:hypothetical protein